MSDNDGAAEHDLSILVLISEMYYIHGRTQKDIADDLGLSRPAVSRLLQTARDQGIVNISIVDPSKRLKELEEELMLAFGLKGCRLCPSGEDCGILKARLGYRGAELLRASLQPGDVIGVGASSTVYEVIKALSETRDCPCLRVVPLSGGNLGIDGQPQINQVVHVAAQRLNAEFKYLNAPLYIGEPSIAESLMEDASIRQCTSLWDQLGCALIGVGNGNIADIHDPYFMAALEAVGHSRVAAAVCGWFLDADGHGIKGKSTTSVSPDQLKKARNVFAIAGGKAKARAILSVLRSEFVTHLVTDEDVARAVLFMKS
ncbi:MAG: sugar-binding domain-containing protein [Clostridia bacterium]|nr:sugar-binding domain-containing protein [Clostridia bacterium]